MEQLVQGSAARVRLSFLKGLASEQSPPGGGSGGGPGPGSHCHQGQGAGGGQAEGARGLCVAPQVPAPLCAMSVPVPFWRPEQLALGIQAKGRTISL